MSIEEQMRELQAIKLCNLQNALEAKEKSDSDKHHIMQMRMEYQRVCEVRRTASIINDVYGGYIKRIAGMLSETSDVDRIREILNHVVLTVHDNVADNGPLDTID